MAIFEFLCMQREIGRQCVDVVFFPSINAFGFYLMAASTEAGMLPLDEVRDLGVGFKVDGSRTKKWPAAGDNVVVSFANEQLVGIRRNLTNFNASSAFTIYEKL